MLHPIPANRSAAQNKRATHGPPVCLASKGSLRNRSAHQNGTKIAINRNTNTTAPMMANRLLANRPARVWELVGLVGLGSGGFIPTNLAIRLAQQRQTKHRKHDSPMRPRRPNVQCPMSNAFYAEHLHTYAKEQTNASLDPGSCAWQPGRTGGRMQSTPKGRRARAPGTKPDARPLHRPAG